MEKQQEKKLVIIDALLIQALLNYLIKQPYDEVNEMIEAVKKNSAVVDEEKIKAFFQEQEAKAAKSNEVKK